MKRFTIALGLFVVLSTLGASASRAAIWPDGAGAGGSWALTGSLHAPHVQPMAVTLGSGKVLLAGGLDRQNHTLASAELFDPKTGMWTQAHSMHVARWAGTMTVLRNGKVLVVGGSGDTTAELYDSATGKWTLTGSLGVARSTHTATLLQNGKVLVVGGYGNDATNPTASAEIYDPTSGKWTQTTSMGLGRENHFASLLKTGQVLVYGGNNDTLTGTEGSGELYNPSTADWSLAGRMMTSRALGTQTLLPDGSIVAAGGVYGDLTGTNPLAMVDRFDPVSRQWFQTGDMKIAPGDVPTIGGRAGHTATLLHDGRVLVAGGSGYINDFNHFVILGTAELYDPRAGAWRLTANLHVARNQHAAAALPDGRVLVAGGVDGNFAPTATAEIFTPSAFARNWNDRVDGMTGYEQQPAHASSRIAGYRWLRHPPSPRAPSIARGFGAFRDQTRRKMGTWKLTGSLNVARSAVPMTLLRNGKVLIEGGDAFAAGGVTAELFDPSTGKWTRTGSMHVARFDQCAQLLPDGRVIVVGGSNGPDAWSSAEIYDPGTGRWTMAHRMNSTRYLFSLLALRNGKLLAPAGIPWDGIPRDSADLYNPATGTWMETRSLNVARTGYLAAALPNGKALVTGGFGMNNTNLNSSELYDPPSNSWSLTGSTEAGAGNAVLLNTGEVLATDEVGVPADSELYNPATGGWTPTIGLMNFVRTADTLTLLTNGHALIAGGCVSGVACPTVSTENYDPVSQRWTLNGTLNVARYVHSAVRLRDGRVLVAGGLDADFHQISSAEIFTP